MYQSLLEAIISVAVFLVLLIIWKFVYKKIENSDNRLLNPGEFFPDEEISTLKQVYYLIMMLIFFILILYLLIYSTDDTLLFAILDVIISLHLLIRLDYSSWKSKIIWLLLLPIGSITFIIFDFSLVQLVDIIHAPIFLYFMKVYYDKFKEYTETNGLGITIVLLFLIIFISFIVTIIVEGVQPFDSLVMVSNAFTSNGYAILGKSPLGKLNSLFLVWGGYILSSVGTATLTAAILTKHFNKKFNKLEELIKENNK